MTAPESAWLAVLRKVAAKPHGAATARRLGYSPAVVSAVLNGNYTGDLAAVQAAVERVLMTSTVECPVLGEISQTTCAEQQSLPPAATNPHRVRLQRTCPQCPNRSRP